MNKNAASLPRCNASTQTYQAITDAERQAMKEAFQRDLDDTVAEMRAEEGRDKDLARGLDFDGEG